jgi:type III secretion system FlhB-like substrate exporter
MAIAKSVLILNKNKMTMIKVHSNFKLNLTLSKLDLHCKITFQLFQCVFGSVDVSYR